MKAQIERWMDSLYMTWTIGSKDIVDALRNKYTRINVVVMMVLVVFFYFMSVVRPWDKSLELVVYDQGDTGQFEGTVQLADGYELRHIDIASLDQLERNLRFEHFGLVVPPNFAEDLASGEAPTLTGYAQWVHRGRVTELEALYSAKLSEMLGQPVQVEVGENIIVPPPDVEASTLHVHLIFASCLVVISLVPSLIVEERKTKTMEALLVSPASTGQVVLGKALAGLFYALVGGGLFFMLNWAAVVNWPLALLAFLGCAIFAIGVALAVGSWIQSPQQIGIWMTPIIMVLVVPAFFSQDPNLSPTLKGVFGWLPTSALARIFQLSLSSRAPWDDLWSNLGIALMGTALVFGLTWWQVRRSDR